MWAQDRDSSDGSPPPSHDGDPADEAGIWEDEGISGLHGSAPSVQMDYPSGFTWDQRGPIDMHGQLGAVPDGHAVNTPWFPQHAPLVYPTPSYTPIYPAQLDSESDVSENEPDQSLNDDPQVKTEDQNYINAFDRIFNQTRELRLADVQLQNEIRTGLNSQSAMLSQSWVAVQKQLRQSRKYCEATKKKLEQVESHHHDRQDEIKELRELLMKKQKKLRRKLKRKLKRKESSDIAGKNKGSVQITWRF
ncbi:uncharacterized protein FFB20_01010 [Fusarium fujikuroi]|uniref:Uncharacterized protein n=2 Tax=Fusarium fujikuroi TaxID=5127 RepID=S0EM47_GIBF5|nr:uncharacterized protein FFUJ_11710 [Fusarium fujikuroi IMI 58289]KLP08755.1 uncharacterized protein Y057_13641 [Fusarium fujikuroi]QGI70938.1 hypothetical protein CEK27_003267 [Fusarium fujikuroi]QGI88276.1 hypothetical protein CEK25_003232 [Fusarium fujikuroi]QGJ01828.1 hypothetical protein CEK26_003272 [Fusarium fujikuroi]CCT75677.1 uncharacterized protein FFUJ_11710 [Fusarium fujikuroi IMI 58289]